VTAVTRHARATGRQRDSAPSLAPPSSTTPARRIAATPNRCQRRLRAFILATWWTRRCLSVAATTACGGLLRGCGRGLLRCNGSVFYGACWLGVISTFSKKDFINTLFNTELFIQEDNIYTVFFCFYNPSVACMLYLLQYNSCGNRSNKKTDVALPLHFLSRPCLLCSKKCADHRPYIREKDVPVRLLNSGREGGKLE